jgi:threonine dehydratase
LIEPAAAVVRAGRAPSAIDLLKAHAFMEKNYLRTALHPVPVLSRDHGCSIFVKCENHGPVRSFKARGALYRMSLLAPEERTRGVIAASTGNHGQGIALAGRRLSVSATIVVPEGTPAIKADNILALGGQLKVFGRDLVEAEAEMHRIAGETGSIIIHDGDDKDLMAGAGTIAWEILDQLPEVDAIVVPVGGGNLIASIAVVAKRLKPGIRIIGVQSEAAPSVYESWRRGTITPAPCETFAGGLATSRPGDLAFAVLKDIVDAMVLVSEDELRCALVEVLATTGQIAEGAGAAPFAALPRITAEIAGQKVVLLLSGGNLPIDDLRELLEGQSRPVP